MIVPSRRRHMGKDVAVTGTNLAFLKQTMIFGLWITISRPIFSSNIENDGIELSHGEKLDLLSRLFHDDQRDNKEEEQRSRHV